MPKNNLETRIKTFESQKGNPGSKQGSKKNNAGHDQHKPGSNKR